mgnify:CR=1 FL=1
MLITVSQKGGIIVGKHTNLIGGGEGKCGFDASRSSKNDACKQQNNYKLGEWENNTIFCKCRNAMQNLWYTVRLYFFAK